jgi:hypothetical protein
LADFPGQRNWGYDGVLFFAPDGSYGRPEDLKALIDAAHERGLTVILDVVYNHFGPEGNYISSYAPQFFNARHQTPWGAAVNFDADGSRRCTRVHYSQCALLARGVSHRRTAPGCRPCHPRRRSTVHVLEELAERVRTTDLPGRYI